MIVGIAIERRHRYAPPRTELYEDSDQPVSDDKVHPWPFTQRERGGPGFEFQSAVGVFDDKAIKELKRLFVAHRDKLPGGSRSVVEVKLDGWRALVVKHPKTGVVACYRRGISKETGTYYDLLQDGPIPQVTEMAAKMGPGDAVEAELVWPGHTATQVPTALKSHRTQLEAIAFAWPYHERDPLLTWQRQHDLIEERRLRRPIVFCGGAHLLTTEYLSDAAEQRKIEGWMVKACDTDEQLWWKAKREVTFDVVVVGTKDSEGYLRGIDGMVGSLLVGVVCVDHDKIVQHKCWAIDFEDGHPPVHIREVANVAGLEDDEREQMTRERDELVGRVCEIRCQASGGIFGGRLRHPRFVRWREDKAARECTGKDLYKDTNGE